MTTRIQYIIVQLKQNITTTRFSGHPLTSEIS